MRKVLLGIAAIAMAATAAAGGKPTMVINEKDDGRTLKVAVNAEIRAVLTQRFDQLWGLYGPSQVTLIEQPSVEGLAFEFNQLTKLSQRTFRVRVTAPGRYPVIFRLHGIQDTVNMKPSREVVLTVEAS